MVRQWWPIVFALAVRSSDGLAQNQLSREYSTRTSPSDYSLRSYDRPNDSLFQGQGPIIDLGIDLGIGSDCGRMDVRGTMRSSLKNMLDAKYFGDLGQNIIAASPMLALCYFSPTWCAIVKHSQLSAHYLSQLRLDQCSLIDKYTDQRSEDYYRQRQTCVRKRIDGEGGNLETAMDSCKDVYGADLASWSGRDGEVATNKLIEGSASWAGLTGDDAKRSIDLTKAFVGDTVVTRGKVSVEFGPDHHPMTPDTHLKSLEKEIHDKVCDGLLRKLAGGRPAEAVLSDRDLMSAIPGERSLLDRQTLEALSFLPLARREEACRKLSDALAVTVLASDLNKSLDVLTLAVQNPNLPPNRRTELEDKRRALKDSIEVTLKLHEERSTPLAKVFSEIGRAGDIERSRSSADNLSTDDARLRLEHIRSTFNDCADNVMCDSGR